MKEDTACGGGENFDLHSIMESGRRFSFKEKMAYFRQITDQLDEHHQLMYMRMIGSAADREVLVYDEENGRMRPMLMFGSNNYLGLANHPYIKEQVKKAAQQFGTGIGGPPLLNGYTSLHRRLEERLAELKKTESAMIFASGYAANLGLVSGLADKDAILIYDAYSHASFTDGIKLSGAKSFRFPHNSMPALEEKLRIARLTNHGDIFVGVEGIYSMDGDAAPLDEAVEICKKYGAILMVDDAHGTGVAGKTGRGSEEAFGVEGKVDVIMGTFSKTFAVTGGFVAASADIINYLRFYARSYMFSATVSPLIIAAVDAALDVMQREPERLEQLRQNIAYAHACLERSGFTVSGNSAIIPIPVPQNMNIRKAAYDLHRIGIFLNSIEYPAVPLSGQRFRVSLMATHTVGDIDRLAEALAEVWIPAGEHEHAV
ncbi:MAG: 8-amino-7-oxononanoate synthase [Ignavibacteriaceae bacterium]|nr:8-amino-7-oxononanoate synthase [Ignavibacteriaceae bacterium]